MFLFLTCAVFLFLLFGSVVDVWDARLCVCVRRLFLAGLVPAGLGFSLCVRSVHFSVVVFISSRSFARRFFRSALFLFWWLIVGFSVCSVVFAGQHLVLCSAVVGGCGLVVQQ